MKRTKIIYWTSTILIAGFMIFSAVPDVMVLEDAKQFVATHLGYPIYIIPFLGLAKLLGSISILIPKFKKIKEWAYAGLTFDLVGATYSNIAVEGFQLGMLMMVLIFGVLIISYVYNEKVNGKNL